MAPADPDAAPADEVLVAAARRGDRAALDQLLHRHFDRIHALCRRIVGNDADADDTTQEALLAVCRGIGRFDGRSAFSTWVYRVTTNACLDEIRRRRRRPLTGDDGVLAEAAGGGFSDGVDAKLDVAAALARLSPEFRAAVVLRDLCQLDYDEIAGVLGIPGGTVRSRIARARGQLSLLLAPGNQTSTLDRQTRPE